ncbi:hypothetical protein ACFQLX_24545 [Streptomyces polyrhachis]|uniref:Uncharacterized protein n=1 Tax=Streptomyces polyrhachis TaxID=1282885 RepID=A0ABW2GKQ8_9ACTN
MPALAIGMAVMDRLIEWKYGTAGVLGLTLLTIGFKIKNTTCSLAGTVVLGSLVSQPAT